MFHINDKVSRNILVACDHGLMCVNRFDRNVNQVGHAAAILDHGNNCTVEAQACIDVIRNIAQPTILDIGANIGSFTSWLARYFPDGRVYSFEPQRLVFQILCANLAINNIHNVYAYNCAVGETVTKIVILEPDYNIPADFGTFSLVKNTIPDKTSPLIIDMWTVDSFIEINQIERVDLLKIDVEGMDMSVLFGAEQTIKKYSPAIFVEYYDNNTNMQNDIEKFLSKFNYKFEYISNNILAKMDKNNEHG